jgi:hypothetical protein
LKRDESSIDLCASPAGSKAYRRPDGSSCSAVPLRVGLQRCV